MLQLHRGMGGKARTQAWHAGHHEPQATQGASAPPQVAGCPWSLAFGDQGNHKSLCERRASVCPTAGGRVPLVPRIWGPGKPQKLMRAKSERLPHRRWLGAPGPSHLGTRETTKAYASEEQASAPPQVAGCPWSLAFGDQGNHKSLCERRASVCPTAGGYAGRSSSIASISGTSHASRARCMG